MQPFSQKLHLRNGEGFTKRAVEVLQVNLGRYCNQACIHCHVEAGPTRKEMMNGDTLNAVLRFLASSKIATLDITGGAPELHPSFDYLVESARKLECHVMDRCNLTVFFEPGKGYLPEFFKRHQLELVCSLPCYTEENVDQQRGKGTFDLSIRGLRILNDLGYGREGSHLTLNLVYNPVGPYLPPAQDKLEEDYQRILKDRFGIVFNHLFCLTNMPITRYETHLKLRGEYDGYMELLANNFNLATLEHVMCRNLISVGYDGSIHDCDFNQMLELPVRDPQGKPLNIASLSSLEQIAGKPIAAGNHCYACTAGPGSSCGGTLIS